MKRTIIFATIAAAMLTSHVMAGDIGACLITKTDTNPYFVKMKEGALKGAKKYGIKLSTFAGKIDGDVSTQVAAVETCMALGVKGILITPSDSRALTPVITKARKAGELIGEWARAKMGKNAENAKIATLDLNPSQVSVDVERHNGFLKGFGIHVKNLNKIENEGDKRVVGSGVTDGDENGGRIAMEDLLQVHPDINLVYSINEPASAGAYAALKATGKEKNVLMVAIDGGCAGVGYIKAGTLGATAMQFPLLMASKGIKAIKTWALTGKKPKNSKGLNFYNTGVQLITDSPMKGIPSIDAAKGLKKCWG